ncbi:hypothetical protein F5X68DRAFT_51606 [Plectosphaerella plurivora]|uniref:Uncharacterized protein n=1 Tax=Plectosphaerella plurivora TaxID=936078 RepID=A0A9P9A4E0_9PEZI|nr:hypothetical protein F5X68DRAFT_51606 [Plectosphaerella plurivora]
MASAAPHHQAFFEEANDDTGSVVEDSKTTASPRKEKPNTGRSRREKLSSHSSDSSAPQTDNELPTPPAAQPPRRSRESRESRPKDKEARQPPREKERPRDPHRERDRERDRERPRNRDGEQRAERPKSSKTVTFPTSESTRRPKPILHSNTAESPDAYRRPKGVIPDNPTHFGLSPGHTPSGTNRPRTNSRPSSYYGAGSRPPASNERWHTQMQQQNQHPFAPVPYSSSPFAAPPPPMLPPSGYHAPLPPAHDYFTSGAMGGPVGSMSSTPTQHLASRFMQRPSSASGFRPQPLPSAPQQQYDEYYDQEPFVPTGINRRSSISRREIEDRQMMPPPPMPMPLARSMTTGPNGGPFRPPPQAAPPLRRLTHYKYEDDDLAAADNSLYRDVGPSRSTSYSYGENAAPPRRPRQDSVTYDHNSYQIEPATSTGRRHSYYGSSSGSVDYQDQLRQAELYQGKMAGDQMASGQMPLTRDSLDKVTRPKRSSDKSSRSTRSSVSRDESDYWAASNTTRTTRSGAGDGENSIRIMGGKGGATVRVGELEIQCPEGEIIINQDGGSTRGSDRGSTVWGDDRPTPRRIANVPYRPRANSQAPPHGRSQYSGSYENYAGHI